MPKELLAPDFWCKRAALTPVEERLLLLPLPRLLFFAMGYTKVHKGNGNFTMKKTGGGK